MDSQTALCTEEDAVAFTVSMTRDLNSVRKERALCDVTVVVGGKEYPAHKLILSVFSPVFKSMFGGNFSEAEKSSVPLENVEADVMDDILEFAYTGNVKCTSETAAKLLQAAHFLQVDSLFAKCSQFLEKNINPENCLHLCELSELYSCPSLYAKSKEYLLKNFSVVCTKEAFLEQKLDFLIDIIQSNILKVLKEEEVFEAVLRWVKFKEDRKSSLPRLLRLIRLGLLKPQYLRDRVKNEEVLWSSMECMQMLFEVLSDLRIGNTSYSNPRVPERDIAIKVEIRGGKTISLKGKSSDSIANIMDKIERETRIPAAEQRLRSGSARGEEMERDRSLSDYVTKGKCECIIDLTQCIEITVRDQYHDLSWQVAVNASDSIENVKEQIEDHLERSGMYVDPHLLSMLQFNGEILDEDDWTVSSYNIKNGDVLELPDDY